VLARGADLFDQYVVDDADHAAGLFNLERAGPHGGKEIHRSGWPIESDRYVTPILPCFRSTLANACGCLWPLLSTAPMAASPPSDGNMKLFSSADFRPRSRRKC